MNKPQHIAIVMDGNGRWAKERGLPRAKGHYAGKDALKAIIGHALTIEIPYISVFAFSSENWHRPQDEVGALMELFESALDKEAFDLSRHSVRLLFAGDTSRFSLPLRTMMNLAEKNTQNNTRLTLTIAVNYGGRWDILQAGKALAEKKMDFTEENFSKCLSFNHLPDPDLFIRTGGEKRISNFMLWQMAYSELYFSDVLWPDFSPAELDKALMWFSQRERRFGKTSEQVAMVTPSS